VAEVGIDRSCAEWLMRNGALIRWVGHTGFVAHYNSLPLDPKDNGVYHIAEVNAEMASITHHGFSHFGKPCLVS
jgi:H+-transporting ATP synthase F0 complex subunit s